MFVLLGKTYILMVHNYAKYFAGLLWLSFPQANSVRLIFSGRNLSWNFKQFYPVFL